MYASTSTYSDDEAEEMYEDISRALLTTQKAHFKVVMEDFNEKVGVHNNGESVIGPHGFNSKKKRSKC